MLLLIVLIKVAFPWTDALTTQNTDIWDKDSLDLQQVDYNFFSALDCDLGVNHFQCTQAVVMDREFLSDFKGIDLSEGPKT